jgi:DNA-binding response OmpR family regulator
MHVPTFVATSDDLEVNAEGMVARVGRRSVRLTARELALLTVLTENRGRVVERKVLYDAVWGRPMAYRDRSVDVFVRKLRGKFDALAPGRQFIHTHYGIGYRFDPVGDDRPPDNLLQPATNP